MGQRSPANAAFLPSNSRQPRHRPRALVAFIGGKPQAHEGFGGAAGAAVLFALFAHIGLPEKGQTDCTAVDLGIFRR